MTDAAAGSDVGDELDAVIPSRADNLPRVVGLGGSAGSIRSLQSLFRQLPADSGMAFVVVVHLDPEHDSILSELLQRVTSMPVRPVHGGETVEKDHVYVIPPGKHLSLRGGQLNLSELPREPGKRFSVDLFFRSLADSFGPHSAAVVLSGADGDGSIGIKRVKERGGLTIAQDPEESEHAGMPRAAIATGMIDWVLPVSEMPPRLVSYHASEGRLRVPAEEGPAPVVAPTPVVDPEAALREVLTLLRARTERDFSSYKRATVVRRVARRMQVNQVDDLPSYLSYLRTHAGEVGALLQDLLISVTNFFRDREAFDALALEIPGMFKGKTSRDTVRVWVPACATGEEAYSIAMLLLEHASQLEAPPALQVFATDLDEDAITTGRQAVYTDAIAADVSAERLRRFFVKQPVGYRLRRTVREVVVFAAHDLLNDSPFSRLELVSCRNLLIYLNPDAQQRVFEMLHFALSPDGRLFLGSSEAVDEASPLFAAIDKRQGLYRRCLASRAAMPFPMGRRSLARTLAMAERQPAQLPRSTGAPSALPPRGSSMLHALRSTSYEEEVSSSDLHLKLVERFAPPSVVVNADYEIVHMSAHAGQFLKFSGGEPSINLLQTVQPSLRRELRAALARAAQGVAPATALAVPMQVGDVQSTVDIRVAAANDIAEGFLLIVFEARQLDQAAQLTPAREEDEPLVRHLERELEKLKRHLRALVQQHEASTEELQASNEELQSMNEELRSATEELETGREELQSINEELTMVNQELKARIEELGSTNSDLHNLMGATGIATVFLDRELCITRFTPTAVDLFNLIATDVGRPLAHLQHRLRYAELIEDADRVLHQLIPIEREVAEDSGRFFHARLLPYRTIEDRIAGVVLTFVDITERHAAQQEVRRVNEELETRVQRRTAELAAANQALQHEVIDHQRVEKRRQELQSRLVLVQEEERKHISRELHDEVGQQLTALMLSLESLESAVPGEEASSRLKSLRATAEKAAREIHQLATDLRPASLDDIGLSGALATYVETWSARSKVHAELVSIGMDEQRLPGTVETTLYRIIQEAMTNVAKHAQAQRVTVTVERRSDRVLASVKDDGVGFDAGAVASGADPTHIGIAGMQERAALLGGQLSVRSSSTGGTAVRVRIPLAAT